MFLKNFPTLQKNKKRHAQPNTDRQKSKRMMKLKLNTGNGLQSRTDRTPAANRRLVSCGVKCLHSSAVFQINFSAGLTVLCSETRPNAKPHTVGWKALRASHPTVGRFAVSSPSGLSTNKRFAKCKSLRKARTVNRTFNVLNTGI